MGLGVTTFALLVSVIALVMAYVTDWGKGSTDIAKYIVIAAVVLSLIGYLFRKNMVLTGVWALFIVCLAWIPLFLMREDDATGTASA